MNHETTQVPFDAPSCPLSGTPSWASRRIADKKLRRRQVDASEMRVRCLWWGRNLVHTLYPAIFSTFVLGRAIVHRKTRKVVRKTTALHPPSREPGSRECRREDSSFLLPPYSPAHFGSSRPPHAHHAARERGLTYLHHLPVTRKRSHLQSPPSCSGRDLESGERLHSQL